MAEAQHARVEKRVEWGRRKGDNYPGCSTKNPASQDTPQSRPGKP